MEFFKKLNLNFLFKFIFHVLDCFDELISKINFKK
jgi:hypothetical protein